MKAQIFFAGKTVEFACEEDESSLWKEVAKKVFSERLNPAFVEVSCEYGEAAFQIINSVEKDMVSSFCYYEMEYNFIYLPKGEKYKEATLKRDDEIITIKVANGQITVDKTVMDEFRYWLEVYSYKERGFDISYVDQTHDMSDKEILFRELSLYKGEKEFSNDISISVVDQMDIKEEILSSRLAAKVNRIYKIVNERNVTAFQQYCKEHNVETTKHFVHGTDKEVLIPIIEHGLTSQGAIKNGRAHGNGVYFSTNGEISTSYSDIRAFNFESGVTKKRYLLICEVAYENVVEGYVPSVPEADCYDSGNIAVVPFDEAICLRYLIEIFD